MKSRIAFYIFSMTLAIVSVSLGGCSGNDDSFADKSTLNDIGKYSENSSVVLPNSGNTNGKNDNSLNESKTSSFVSTPESIQPSGTPTIFIGPDENPIYDTDVTRIICNDPNFSKEPAEITAEDEDITIFCEGFQYFKEPAGKAYCTYENPEMFDGAEFKNVLPENRNTWKRINVGDEICGLTLKSATSTLNNYCKENFDHYQTYYTCDVSDFNLFAEFDGSVTLTGYLNSSCRSSYEPDGGELRLTPTENKLPIMPASMMYKIEPETYVVAKSYGGGEMYAVNEINLIGIDNPLGIDLGYIGIGDTAYVRLTISNIKYLVAGTVTADLVDIEVLSDVLAHEDDSI